MTHLSGPRAGQASDHHPRSERSGGESQSQKLPPSGPGPAFAVGADMLFSASKRPSPHEACCAHHRTTEWPLSLLKLSLHFVGI